MSTLDIHTQARIITDAVKPADLLSPTKLAKILRDYAIRYNVNASSSPTSALGLLASGVTADSGSLLGILNPAPQAADTSSNPLLQLFTSS